MDDIKEKQDYLCREIIEQNYDPEEFQEYLEKKKGLALQDYSKQELEIIVREFQKGEHTHQIKGEESFVVSKESQIGGMKDQQQNMMEYQLKEMQERSGPSHNHHSSNSSNIVHKQYLKKQTVSTIYNDIFKKGKNIAVKIRSYSKKQGNSLFGSTYVCYMVQTPQRQWSVSRRFKDFEWLQLKLTELLPGYPIPPIPKKTKLRSFDDKHLQERMNTFEQYLNRLLSIPEICSLEIVEEFLRTQSSEEFQNNKELFQQKLRNRGNKIQTLKGQELIDKETFRIEIQEYQFYKTTKQLTKNLNALISSLQTLLKQATEKSFQLSSCFNELHHHISSHENTRGGEIYSLMGDFINQLGYKLEGDYCFVKGFMENYWSYEEKYLNSLLAYMSKSSKQQSQLISRYKNLGQVQIDSDNGNSEQQNSKIFVEYQQARELYRLRLSMLQEQLTRHTKNDLLKLSKVWTTGLTHYVQGVKNLILTSADQLTRALCLNEGKELREVQYLSKHHHHQHDKQRMHSP